MDITVLPCKINAPKATRQCGIQRDVTAETNCFCSEKETKKAPGPNRRKNIVNCCEPNKSQISQCRNDGMDVGRCQTGFTTRLAGSISHSGLFLLLLLFTLLHTSDAIQWMAVAKRRDDSWNKSSSCQTEGLDRLQKHICSEHLELMPAIARASRQAAQVCQELFFDSRWNCSSVLRAPKFLPDLKGGSREQAVVHALASASLTQTIAKHCSTGVSLKCSCGTLPADLPEGEFKWGGCPDNVKYGLSFSEIFTASPYLKNNRSKRAIMNLQNDLVGRRVMASSLTTSCKCHGVSGSCTTKTCWKSLADLRTVGAVILERYSVAVEVVPKRSLARHPRVPGPGRARGTTLTPAVTSQAARQAGGKREKKEKKKRRDNKLVPFLRGKTEYSEDELIFYTQSPDYCLPEDDLGSVGTRGRECQKDDPGSAGCGSMCCGRGFVTELVDVQYRCECKYFWCCYVKCKTCTKTVEVARCK